MILRLSSFVHLVPVGEGRVLVIHALSHLRMVVDRELAQMIGFFATPREMADDGANGSGSNGSSHVSTFSGLISCVLPVGSV